MSDINYNLLFKLGGDNKVMALIEKIAAGMKRTDEGVDGLNKKFSNLPNIISKSLGAIKLNAILDQVDRVATGLNSIAQPGADLSNQMYDLQAITGVAGEKLKQIEGYARDAAKEFGGSAAANVESYKLILSQLISRNSKTARCLKSNGRCRCGYQQADGRQCSSSYRNTYYRNEPIWRKYRRPHKSKPDHGGNDECNGGSGKRRQRGIAANTAGNGKRRHGGKRRKCVF